MTCPICGNKPMNCDCTQEARQLYSLRQEMAEKEDSSDYNERRELFKSVALIFIKQREFRNSLYDSDLDDVRQTTETILQAASNFSKDKPE